MIKRYFFFILFFVFFAAPSFTMINRVKTFLERSAKKLRLTKYKSSKYEPSKYEPTQIELTEYKPSEYKPTEFKPSQFKPTKYKPSIKIPKQRKKTPKRFYTKTETDFPGKESWLEWFRRLVFGNKKKAAVVAVAGLGAASMVSAGAEEEKFKIPDFDDIKNDCPNPSLCWYAANGEKKTIDGTVNELDMFMQEAWKRPQFSDEQKQYVAAVVKKAFTQDGKSQLTLWKSITKADLFLLYFVTDFLRDKGELNIDKNTEIIIGLDTENKWFPFIIGDYENQPFVKTLLSEYDVPTFHGESKTNYPKIFGLNLSSSDRVSFYWELRSIFDKYSKKRVLLSCEVPLQKTKSGLFNLHTPHGFFPNVSVDDVRTSRHPRQNFHDTRFDELWANVYNNKPLSKQDKKLFDEGFITPNVEEKALDYFNGWDVSFTIHNAPNEKFSRYKITVEKLEKDDPHVIYEQQVKGEIQALIEKYKKKAQD